MIFRVEPRRDRALWAALKVHPELVVRPGRVAWRVREFPAMCVLVTEGAAVLRGPDGAAVGLAGRRDLVGLGGGGAGGAFRGHELRALRPCRVVPVPAARVEGALRRGSTTLPEVLRSMEDAAALARSVAGGAGRAPAAVRLARVVREAAHRIGSEGGKGTRVDDVPHRVWAEWAGLHRSTVTTLLNEWIYDGTLGQTGRALVVGPLGSLPGEPPRDVDPTGAEG